MCASLSRPAERGAAALGRRRGQPRVTEPVSAGVRVGALAAQGKWNEAVQAVKDRAEDKNGYWRAQAVIEASRVAIAKDKVDRVAELLSALPSTDDDFQAYRDVTQELVIAGKPDAISDLLKDAHPAAKSYAAMGRAAAVGKEK